MSKVRINDLARELEVKSRAILDALTAVGVTEKKTHSSSLEEDEAERVRQHFQRGGRNGSSASRADNNEPKQKIDWSRVSKPGDVLKAIQQRRDEAAAVAQRPPVPPPPPPAPVARPVAPVAMPPSAPAQSPVVHAAPSAPPRRSTSARDQCASSASAAPSGSECTLGQRSHPGAQHRATHSTCHVPR